MPLKDASGSVGVKVAFWLRSYTGPDTVGTFNDHTATCTSPTRAACRCGPLANGSAVLTVARLRTALGAGTLASTAFTVVVDKRTQAVLALGQQR